MRECESGWESVWGVCECGSVGERRTVDAIDAAVAAKAQAQVEKALAGQLAAAGQDDGIAVEEGDNLLHGLHVLRVLGVVHLVALQQPLVRVLVHLVGIIDQRGHAAGGEDYLSPIRQFRQLIQKGNNGGVVERPSFNPSGLSPVTKSAQLVTRSERRPGGITRN